MVNSYKQCSPEHITWMVAPVIRFRYKEKHSEHLFTIFLSTGAECPVMTARLLRCYNFLEPRFRELSVFLHVWLKVKANERVVHDICPPFVMQLLLLVFLQTRNPPVLPNLQILRAELHPLTKPAAPLHVTVLKDSKEQTRLTVESHFYIPSQSDRSETLIGEEFDRPPKLNSNSAARLLVEFFYFYAHKFKVGSD